MAPSATRTLKPNLTALLADVLRLREQAERQRAALERANAEVEQAESLLLDGMAAAGLTGFQDDEGNRATRTEWLWATPTDEAELFRWLRAHGHGSLIKRTVHGQSLSAVIRQVQSDGGEVPTCVRVTVRPRLLIRKP